MIDLHFHCLPGIDDGPASLGEAVALCRAASQEGVERLVATPHVLRGDWINEDPAARDELVLRLNDRLEGRPAVLSGCEAFFSSELVELVERGTESPLTRLNRGRYLLIELPPGASLRAVERTFHEVLLLDVTPVLAHPERHSLFRHEPEALSRLVRGGAAAQLTAGSLLGDFGGAAQASAGEFLDLGLIAVVASDAHNLGRRPPRLTAAREMVRRRWGSEVEQGLFEANPRAVLESRTLPWGLVRPRAARSAAR